MEAHNYVHGAQKALRARTFLTEQSVVSVLITRDNFYAMQSEKFVEDTFDGSLPAFIAAFASRKKPSEQEIAEIRRMIEEFGKEK